MTSLATTDDLSDWIGEANVDTTRAQLLLDAASGLIRNYCRQTISAVSGDTITLDSNAGDRLYLPERPVTAVTNIAIEGTTVDPSAYRVRGNIVFRIDGYPWDFGQVTRIGEITVTYDHGYATVPDEVKAICLAVAARAFTFRDSSQSASYGEAPEAAGFGPDLILFKSEKRALTEGGYRMPRISSQNITAGEEREVRHPYFWAGAIYGEE